MERHALYSDSDIHGLGNKLAYELHTQRANNTGIWVHIKPLSETVPNGKYIAKLSQAHNGHGFRFKGNDFRVWFPSTKESHRFTRAYRASKLQGQHAIGMGHNANQAEQSQIIATAALKEPNHTSIKALLKEKPADWSEGKSHNAIHHEPKPHDFGLNLANPLKKPDTDD
jgi:hypothetical protein